MFLIFAGITILLMVLTAVSLIGSAATGEPTSASETVLGFMLIALPFTAVALRYFARGLGVSTFLFVLIAIALLATLVAQLGIFLFSDLGRAAGADHVTIWVVVPFILVLAFLVYFSLTFGALRHGATRHRWLQQEIERARKTVPRAVLEHRVHGHPGAGLDQAARRFGTVNVAIGQLGERMTATLLEELLVMPGVQVVHGLKFPGSQFADVDHAVMAGSRIAFIDTKLWKPAAYVLDPSGTILENGRMNAHRQSNHAAVVEKMAAAFPNCEVRGWIVVHPQDDRHLSVSSRGDASRTRLVDADGLLREVGDWLSPGGHILDLFVVAEVLEHRNW